MLTWDWDETKRGCGEVFTFTQTLTESRSSSETLLLPRESSQLLCPSLRATSTSSCFYLQSSNTPLSMNVQSQLWQSGTQSASRLKCTFDTSCEHERVRVSCALRVFVRMWGVAS